VHENSEKLRAFCCSFARPGGRDRGFLRKMRSGSLIIDGKNSENSEADANPEVSVALKSLPAQLLKQTECGLSLRGVKRRSNLDRAERDCFASLTGNDAVHDSRQH